jgi:hypothetical protein
MPRWAFQVAITTSGMLASACGFLGTDEGGPPDYGALSDGAVILPGSCSSFTYIELPFPDGERFEGPGAACAGSLDCNATFETCTFGVVVGGYYALCVDGSYSVCSCVNPNLIPDYGGSGGWQEVLPDGAPVGALPDGAPVRGLDCGAEDARSDRSVDARREAMLDSASERGVDAER